MLPKKNRADKKTVESLFKQGRSINSPLFTFKFIRSADSPDKKISFIVPKSLAKLAVKRNSLRRKGYAALSGVLASAAPGISGAFIFKKYEENISILEKDIKGILDKAN